MANDSSTGGYLSPDGPLSSPRSDIDLDKLFQGAVAGITGLPGSMVRPRWQPVTPKQPEPSVDWCALGVAVVEPDAGPALSHNAAGLGSDTSIRHEQIDVMLTFYGPNAGAYASRLRDGLGLVQNIEALRAQSIAFVETGQVRTVPDLVNQQWIRRCDMLARFRRKVTRTYSVLNIVAADVHLFDDSGRLDELIQVQPPAP